MGDIKAAQRIRIYDGVNDTEVAVAVRDVAAGAADGGILAQAVRLDAGASLVGTTGDYSPLQVDSVGNLRVSVTGGGNASVIVDDAAFTPAATSVTMMGAFADEAATDSVDEGDGGALRMTLDRKLLVRVVGSTDANRMEVSAAGAVHTNLAQVLGATHSETNPVFVQVVNTTVSASEIHDYNTIASVASDAADNHVYGVANATFLLKRILVAASGAAKWEVQTGPTAGLLTVAVAFTSAANPTEQIVFDPPHEVPVAATGQVVVIRRNDDNQAMDLYSTIMGNDV